MINIFRNKPTMKLKMLDVILFSQKKSENLQHILIRLIES